MKTKKHKALKGKKHKSVETRAMDTPKELQHLTGRKQNKKHKGLPAKGHKKHKGLDTKEEEAVENKKKSHKAHKARKAHKSEGSHETSNGSMYKKYKVSEKAHKPGDLMNAFKSKKKMVGEGKMHHKAHGSYKKAHKMKMGC